MARPARVGPDARRPDEFVEGQLTGILGVLWATGGAWLLAAWLVGVFDDGWSPGVLAVAVVAMLLGAGLLSRHRQRLASTAYLVLTMLGAGAITLATLWGGPTGTAAVGVLYAYVACFSFIALRRYAVRLVVASAALHLVALVVVGDADVLGIWVLTWGCRAGGRSSTTRGVATSSPSSTGRPRVSSASSTTCWP